MVKAVLNLHCCNNYKLKEIDDSTYSVNKEAGERFYPDSPNIIRLKLMGLLLVNAPKHLFRSYFYLADIAGLEFISRAKVRAEKGALQKNIRLARPLFLKKAPLYSITWHAIAELAKTILRIVAIPLALLALLPITLLGLAFPYAGRLATGWVDRLLYIEPASRYKAPSFLEPLNAPFPCMQSASYFDRQHLYRNTPGYVEGTMRSLCAELKENLEQIKDFISETQDVLIQLSNVLENVRLLYPSDDSETVIEGKVKQSIEHKTLASEIALLEKTLQTAQSADKMGRYLLHVKGNLANLNTELAKRLNP